MQGQSIGATYAYVQSIHNQTKLSINTKPFRPHTSLCMFPGSHIFIQEWDTLQKLPTARADPNILLYVP